MAYVGPPTQYDFMGATQFRLLCALGLRANHHVLDCGCGSLRAGRLLMTYLDPGRYFGIEPNRWLIEESITHQIGQDLIRIKAPRFDHNSDFATNVFGTQFDFIIAQSIFSHTGNDLVAIALRNFKESLRPDGLIVATFIEGSNFDGNGWIYPGCVTYRVSAINRFAKEAGLFAARLPWYHPRQTWYLLAKDPGRLPTRAMSRFLNGAVLFDPEFVDSWKTKMRPIWAVRHYFKIAVRQPIKNVLRKLLKKRA